MVAITHPFVSPKSDGADGTLLQPTAWNAEHTLAAGAAGGVLAMGNGAVIWNAGTSFPASKATGDRYFRTDLGMEFYWDGTRWASVIESSLAGSSRTAVGTGFTATQANVANFTVPGVDCYLTTCRVVTYVASANTGSAYWTIDLSKLATNNTPSSLGTTSTGTTPDSNTTWTPHVITINAAVNAATNPALVLGVTKTSTPGGLILSWDLRYRIIAT